MPEEEMKRVIAVSVTEDSDFGETNLMFMAAAADFATSYVYLTDAPGTTSVIKLFEAQNALFEVLLNENNVLDSQKPKFARLFYERLVEMGKDKFS